MARAAAGLIAAALTVAAVAEAAPNDAAALALDRDAMGRDYFETRFVNAQKKLERALALCGKKRCSPKVLARLHRDLGVVHIGGLGATERGKAELAQALAIDPSIQLDNDYATSAMREAFEELRAAQKGELAIEHEPVAAQARNTPVPVSAEVDGDAAKTRLIVRFKGPADTAWRSQPMRRAGSRFTALIPCDATRDEGQLAYFIEAVQDDEIVAHHGSRKKPHRVAIEAQLDGPAPHLPDEAPPERCGEEREAPAPEPVCHGEDCAAPREPAAGKTRKNWFHLLVQQDVSILPGDSDVCTADNQVNGQYSCFRPQGSQYHGTPLVGQGDAYDTGVSVATTRILVGYDRVLVAGLTLGLRFGYAVRGGGPRPDGADVHPFMPWHAEARLAYWFGRDAFATSGVRPLLFACGGIGQIDGAVSVEVAENPTAPRPPSQLDNPRVQDLSVYRHMGQGFAGGGVGLYYAITPAVAIGADVKVMQFFPTLGTAFAPELGFAAGI